MEDFYDYVCHLFYQDNSKSETCFQETMFCYIFIEVCRDLSFEKLVNWIRRCSYMALCILKESLLKQNMNR